MKRSTTKKRGGEWRDCIAATSHIYCEPYSAKGYLADKLTEYSVVISKSDGLALLRQRGYIFKDEVADFS